jgi:hypothetical protein
MKIGTDVLERAAREVLATNDPDNPFVGASPPPAEASWCC